MKHLIYYIVITLSVLLLCGCATQNTYQEPSASQAHATIHGVDKTNLLTGKREYVYIESIDNRKIGTIWSTESKLRLSPGLHQIQAYVAFMQIGFITTTSQAASLLFNLNARAGENYTFNGLVQGETISAWIVNRHGQAVSAKATSSHLPVGARSVHVPEMQKG